MSELLVKIDEKDLALIAGLGIAFVVYSRVSQPAIKPSALKNGWEMPESGYPFLTYINKATRDYNLPPKLLGRVLYQESHFRPEIINGTLKSSAGAVGIAQIVPKWHPEVSDPTDPVESIDYAGAYLRKLFNRFGNWGDALAAYNWGQGNLDRYKKGELTSMPTETKRYVNQISGDVLV